VSEARRLAGQLQRFGWQLMAPATSVVIAFSAALGAAGGYEPVDAIRLSNFVLVTCSPETSHCSGPFSQPRSARE
jgi:hypothetical protein|tara:strand:+ start:3960 stop:4184 length:225 start_codon:yes stop_codon:yes gene_type:complete